MPNLIIGANYAFVYQPDSDCKYTGRSWMYKTELFLGDAIALLEEKYPDIPTDDASYLRYLENDIFGASPKTLWGLKEGCSVLRNFDRIVDKYEVAAATPYLELSIKDADNIRLYYRVNSHQYHDSFFDGYANEDFVNENAVAFLELDTITKVLMAALYYYTLNGYKLVRCKHCGKWFATKTLKEQYCKRTSPCFGDVITGKTPLPCEQAVRNIKQKQSRRHKNVYSYLDISAKDQEDIEYFKMESKKLKEAITHSPSVENFKKYEDFLNRYPKRMVRT